MAVSVLMSPVTANYDGQFVNPNATNTNLVYTLSSSLSSNPQFRYVTDIYESGSTNRLVRLTTYPNTYGTVNLDVSRELNDRIGWDNVWDITGSLPAVESYKTFDLRFGEEYGTSISSSRTIYTGSTSNYLSVFPGTVYKDEGSYNFDWKPFPEYLDSTWDAFFPFSNFFKENTEQYAGIPLSEYKEVEVGDYETLSFPSDIIFPAVGPLSRYRVSTYNSSGTLLQTSAWISGSDAFQTLGVGPQNFIDLGGAYAAQMTGSWDRYTVLGNNGTYSGVYRFKKRESCYSEYTRFAFINMYGFWDYYNVYNPLRRQSQVDRSTYERTFVRYEDRIGSYDISNRGTTQYYTEYNDIFEITTDYIDKPTADWLTELFESPDVYIQSGTDFIPVNILNTQVTWNLDQNRNKLFQYTITFKYANQREPR